MSEVKDLTIEILRQIRDEVRLTRVELSERIDRTNERLDRTNERLDQVGQDQIRHATAIVELEKGQRELQRGQVAIVEVLERLSAGQERMIDQLQRMNARIDGVFLGPLGSAVRDHDERITKLEQFVAVAKRRPG